MSEIEFLRTVVIAKNSQKSNPGISLSCFSCKKLQAVAFGLPDHGCNVGLWMDVRKVFRESHFTSWWYVVLFLDIGVWILSSVIIAFKIGGIDLDFELFANWCHEMRWEYLKILIPIAVAVAQGWELKLGRSRCLLLEQVVIPAIEELHCIRF